MTEIVLSIKFDNGNMERWTPMRLLGATDDRPEIERIKEFLDNVMPVIEPFSSGERQSAIKYKEAVVADYETRYGAHFSVKPANDWSQERRREWVKHWDVAPEIPLEVAKFLGDCILNVETGDIFLPTEVLSVSLSHCTKFQSLDKSMRISGSSPRDDEMTPATVIINRLLAREGSA